MATIPGYNPSVWSTQGGAYRHVLGGTSHISSLIYINTRWGFMWNNEADFNSCDVGGGIGMYTASVAARSGGDIINCCQVTAGFNRAMRYELFGR